LKRYLILLLVLFAVVLAGCGPEAEELVSTALPVATDVPTVQPTSPPAAMNTLMPNPSTNTPEPTLTATERPPNEPEFYGILKYDIEKWDASMVFSQDGKKIVIFDETVQLWDVDTLELITKFRFQDPDSDNYAATKAVFSSDGSLLAVNAYDKGNEYFVPDVDNRLLVFDVVSGELLREWQLEDAIMPDSSYYAEPYEIRLNAMAFIPDSSRLVFATGNRLEIWDVFRDEAPIVIDLGKEMYADQISIREDGKFISILMDWYKDH
jgi:WD40 repeat protein